MKGLILVLISNVCYLAVILIFWWLLGGYCSLPSAYCSLPSGYCSLLVVTARYRLLLLVPNFGRNQHLTRISWFKTHELLSQKQWEKFWLDVPPRCFSTQHFTGFFSLSSLKWIKTTGGVQFLFSSSFLKVHFLGCSLKISTFRRFCDVNSLIIWHKLQYIILV